MSRWGYKRAHGVLPEDDTMISPEALTVANDLLSDRHHAPYQRRRTGFFLGDALTIRDRDDPREVRR